MSAENSEISKLNTWAGLAKNLVWVIGLIAIVLYKFQEQENINVNQTLHLRMLTEEHEKLDTKLHKLEENTASCTYMINTLKSQVEAEQRSQRDYRR